MTSLQQTKLDANQVWAFSEVVRPFASTVSHLAGSRDPAAEIDADDAPVRIEPYPGATPRRRSQLRRRDHGPRSRDQSTTSGAGSVVETQFAIGPHPHCLGGYQQRVIRAVGIRLTYDLDINQFRCDVEADSQRTAGKHFVMLRTVSFLHHYQHPRSDSAAAIPLNGATRRESSPNRLWTIAPTRGLQLT